MYVFLGCWIHFWQKNILTTFQGRIMSSRGAKNVKYWLKPGKNIFFSKLHVWGVWIYGFFWCWIHFLHKQIILTNFQGRIVSSKGAKKVTFLLKPGKNIFFLQIVCLGGLNICAESIFCTNKLFWPTFRAVLWVPVEPKRSNLGFNMVKILFSPNCIVRCLNILNYQNIHLFHIKLG